MTHRFGRAIRDCGIRIKNASQRAACTKRRLRSFSVGAKLEIKLQCGARRAQHRSSVRASAGHQNAYRRVKVVSKHEYCCHECSDTTESRTRHFLTACCRFVRGLRLDCAALQPARQLAEPPAMRPIAATEWCVLCGTRVRRTRSPLALPHSDSDSGPQPLMTRSSCPTHKPFRLESSGLA